MSETPAPDRFATIAYVYSQSDLALLLSLFRQADIHVLGVQRHLVSIDPGIVTALGGVELRVHQEDGDEARAMLATLDPRPYRAPLPFGFWPLDLLLFLAIAFFGVGPPPRQLPTFVLGEAAARREA
jgi:hypothetical protein